MTDERTPLAGGAEGNVSKGESIMRHLPQRVKPPKAFLDYFPDPRRSWVMERFLSQVRGGMSDPEAIVSRVLTEATRKAVKAGNDEDRTRHVGLILALEDHPDEAGALARYCLWWKSLPRAEQARVNAGRFFSWFPWLRGA